MHAKRALIALLLLTSPALAAEVALPPAGAQYDSQLGGAYPPPAGTRIVSRDRENDPAPGLYNICYVNAFQTQPQDADWWQENHPDLLLLRDGALVEDANWPGEYLLDTTTEPKRAALSTIVGEWIAKCASDGFDAIEADNLDTYLRSDGLIAVEDNLALARLLIDQAHALGLAFGQKNSSDLGERGRAVGMDFAITESCQVYDECGAYIDVFGRHVLEIEYTDTPRVHFDDACERHGHNISVILRDRDLTTPGDPTYLYAAC
jgi:hypothetical protein